MPRKKAAEAAATDAAPAAPKKRGRPKKAAAPVAVKRGPGRPKGSTNKKKSAAKKAPAAKAATGRRRGRPAAGLAGQLDKMIRELESMRAQVRQLEQLRSAVDNIKKI